MSTNFRIAFRFLTARRRAMFMSLSCIVLGVGLFVVTQATTTGFEKFFIRTILGTDGAIRVEDRIQATIRTMEAHGGGDVDGFVVEFKDGVQYVEGVDEPRLVIDALQKFSNVSGTSEVLHSSAEVRSNFKNASARVYGINLEDHLSVSDLGRQIVQGDLTTFRESPSGVLMGVMLAERLQLQVGDSFLLKADTELRRYRVSAIFETGIGDIDKVRVYMHMGEARSLLKKRRGASFIQVNLFDRDRAPLDAAHMEAVLGHSAAPWQEREKIWLNVFSALKVSTGITVSVFTLIAGLAMYNTLALIVMEKTKDIAILRSMGYTRVDITRIFLWQAVIVLAVGAVLGCGLGAGVTYVVSLMPMRIRGIFSTDRFLVDWSIWHYVAAVGISIVMVMVASLIPARRAARLEPGDVIRGTAQ
ncbi:MAG TPA: FtsX-like permease family protein [Opitutaceae bacterium]|nr:FtsX-like permease family protein [Opitutaceae bacterium]